MVFGLFGKQDVEHIVNLYEESCGLGRSFARATCSNPAQVLKEFRRIYPDGYGLGSKWTKNSKLIIQPAFLRKNVRVEFDLNYDPREVDQPTVEEAQRVGDEFEKRANDYLKSRRP